MMCLTASYTVLIFVHRHTHCTYIQNKYFQIHSFKKKSTVYIALTYYFILFVCYFLLRLYVCFSNSTVIILLSMSVFLLVFKLVKCNRLFPTQIELLWSLFCSLIHLHVSHQTYVCRNLHKQSWRVLLNKSVMYLYTPMAL